LGRQPPGTNAAANLGAHVPLSEDEQRILDQIAAEFHERDPVLAGELENTTLWTHALRQMKWAGLLFVVGVGILVVALASASSFYVAFGGFVVMLGAALWFERNASRLGRAGWQHLRSAGSGQGFRHYLDEQQERMRDRFRHED
jgi:hypothetical protein